MSKDVTKESRELYDMAIEQTQATEEDITPTPPLHPPQNPLFQFIDNG
jgi:hypothetical protein